MCLCHMQGIPDEYDEADINRLFSGKRQILSRMPCLSACIADRSASLPDCIALSESVTQQDSCCNPFAHVGFPGVMHVRIVRDRGTGQSRGFGFVVSVNGAIALNVLSAANRSLFSCKSQGCH